MMPPQDAMAPGTAPHDSAAPEGQPAQLHDLAMTAEKAAEQLATGLARISADPAAVKAVTQCAEIMRQLATGLAQQALAGHQATVGQPPQQQPQPHQSIGGATNDMYASMHH